MNPYSSEILYRLEIPVQVGQVEVENLYNILQKTEGLEVFKVEKRGAIEDAIGFMVLELLVHPDQVLGTVNRTIREGKEFKEHLSNMLKAFSEWRSTGDKEKKGKVKIIRQKSQSTSKNLEDLSNNVDELE